MFFIGKVKSLLLIFEDDYPLGESFRYIIIGGASAVIDLTLFAVFIEIFHFWYIASCIMSFSIASFFGYFGQKYFTFKNSSKKHIRQFVLFYFIVGIGLLINTFSIFCFVDILGLYYMYAGIITKFIVLVWNFFANKFITFSNLMS